MLTISQLADIIFQKPDRVTAGILSRRGALQGWMDDHLVYRHQALVSEMGGLKQSLCAQWMRATDSDVPLAEEHPQSLSKAARELKALGFSNRQIDKIRICVHVFAANIDAIDPYLYQMIKNETGDYGRMYNDKAFLGIAGTPCIVRPYKTPAEFKAHMAEQDRLRADAANNRNTVFPAGLYDALYSLFKGHLEGTVEGQKEFFLKPEKPRQAFKVLGL